jgi:hypothetical protein
VPGVERNRALQDADQKLRANVGVERFNGTVLDEFFREAFRAILYETVEALQENPDRWLRYYNLERPHQGYRNMRRRPFEIINQHLESVRKEDQYGIALTFSTCIQFNLKRRLAG